VVAGVGQRRGERRLGEDGIGEAGEAQRCSWDEGTTRTAPTQE
jgi:hypothetical protein